MALAALNDEMTAFYTDPTTRAEYQGMLDADASAQPGTKAAMQTAILERAPRSILEVGCGSGRL